MKIWDNIRAAFSRRDNHTLRYTYDGYCFPLEITQYKFGESVFVNIVEILTDIFAEVEFQQVGVPTAKFKAWRDWVYRNGQRVLVNLYRHKGYCVVGYDSKLDTDGSIFYRFYEIPEKDYNRRVLEDGREVIEMHDKMQQYYVLKTPTFEATGMSDHELCKPFIKLIDAVLNGATTTAERLGAYVVASPKTDNFGGVLTKGEKDDLEKEMQKEYGMLRRQKQIMTLSRPMDMSVVSLASVDTRMKDKYTAAVLAIADRVKVPVNQIALVDGGQSKAFANGTEYREGDMAKYRQFRRLLNATFYDMAVELGMQIDYTIENEPVSVQGQTINKDEDGTI